MAKIVDLLSRYSDTSVLQLYKDYLIKNNINIADLTNKFMTNKDSISGVWFQVITNPVTKLFGTGIRYSSVQATYTLHPNGSIGVLNEAFDDNFKKDSIEGISRTRNNDFPTCRTVKFDSMPIEGDFWIVDISPEFDYLIIVGPAVVPLVPILLYDSFSVYVLARNRDKFWNSDGEQVLEKIKKLGFDNFLISPVASGKSLSL